MVFIDVWEEPGAGTPYGVRMIPTQIFFDSEGQELFRHVGFYTRDIVAARLILRIGNPRLTARTTTRGGTPPCYLPVVFRTVR